ncbi:DMT family transporter [Micromonospora sp. WMMD961]|uniref:DMT family transporter n=1 Tax=Micromonospora sp. WMMD961 TaxID=3016100 RepID=UPI002417E18A|nr:DMT family transporter [Micromonospora sp. WMMD961]MDG4782476.1 DMT family transporter [Micromonospora sp. WMMD961]
MVALIMLGGILALQTRINGQLGSRLGDGFLAAAVIFLIGLTLTMIAMLVSGSGRAGLRAVRADVKAAALPRWILFGGAVGSVFVIGQGLVAALLGTAVFSTSTVAGQTVGGLFVDRLGIGPSGKHSLTVRRLAGAALGLVAVGWSVSADLTGGFPVVALAVPLLGGLCIGWQQAVNGRVRVAANSVITSTFVNFLGGAIVTGTLAAIRLVAAGAIPRFPTEGWLYAGGLTSLLFIAATSQLVRRTGVLMLGVGTTAGQLLVSLALDLFLPQPGAVIRYTMIAGTALALVSVVIVSTPASHAGR